MPILLTVRAASAPHAVRNLSEALAISRPAVSRALNLLCELGYARRLRDECGQRSMRIARTELGVACLGAFADRISRMRRALTGRTPFQAGTPQSVWSPPRRRLDIEGGRHECLRVFLLGREAATGRRRPSRTACQGDPTFLRVPGRPPARRATWSLSVPACVWSVATPLSALRRRIRAPSSRRKKKASTVTGFSQIAFATEGAWASQRCRSRKDRRLLGLPAPMLRYSQQTITRCATPSRTGATQ